MAKLAMGELEATVMDILWDSGGWRTPREVHDVVVAERQLGYTTVTTILVRLWQKGRLERQLDGRAYAYRPVTTREGHVAARMHEMLSGTSDRPMALSRFVESLSPADRSQLRRLLANAKRAT